MAKLDLKTFCKEFKAYEKKVGKGKAWQGVLSEVGNAVKNESTRSFERQQSPFNETWKALSVATLKKKKGSLKLVESGHLKRSIQSHSDLNKKAVSVGSNLSYGAIHQFGGKAGRGRKVTIPARPFLPINNDDKLSPQLQRRIESILKGFLKL